MSRERSRSLSYLKESTLTDAIICIAIFRPPSVYFIWMMSRLALYKGRHISVKNSLWDIMYMFMLWRERLGGNTRCCIFEVFTVTPWPPVAPSSICYPILHIIHNESSLVSSPGWYPSSPSSMTLNSLNSLSSSQLVDRGPKFITSFHFLLPAYLIYDSINNNHCCRMPCHPQCPSCPLPARADYHQLFGPLKLYLLISLSGPVILFLRVMPGGKAKSDLPIALSAVSHHSRMIRPLFCCRKLAQSNQFFSPSNLVSVDVVGHKGVFL